MSLGEAAVDVVSDTSKFEGGLSKSIGTIGKAAVGVAVGVGAIGAAAVGGAFKTAALADEVDKASARAGVASDTYQELAFWASQNGIESASMEKAVGRLTTRVGEAALGNEKYMEAFQGLGVSIHDANGELRSTDDIVNDAIRSLSGIEDPALQAAAAVELFGERQARELLPALREGALTMDEAARQAHELGLVMDSDVVAAGARFSDAWDRIKRTVGGVLRDALTPLMLFLADTVFPFIEDRLIPAVRGLWEAFSEGDGIVDGIMNVFGELTGSGGVGSIFEKVREIVQNVFSGIVDWLATGGIGEILNALLEARQRLFDAALQLFPAILDALIKFLPELLGFITDQLIPQILAFILEGVPLLLETAVMLFTQLVEAVVTVLPMLIQTLLGQVLPQLITTVLGMIPDLLSTAIDLFLMLVDAVVTILPELIKTLLGTVLPNLLTTILKMAPEILVKAIEVFFSLVTGLLEILPDLISTLIGVVLPELITTLIGMIPELITTAITVFVALAEGIIRALPEIIRVILFELIPAIAGAVGNLGSELFNAGVNAMGDLLGGIKKKAGEVVGWVKDNVVGAIKNLWPFSPAKEGPFAGRGSPLHAGENIMAMLAEGLERGRREVEAAARAATAGLQASLTGPAPAAGPTAAGQVIHLTVHGNPDPVTVFNARDLARTVVAT